MTQDELRDALSALYDDMYADRQKIRVLQFTVGVKKSVLIQCPVFSAYKARVLELARVWRGAIPQTDLFEAVYREGVRRW